MATATTTQRIVQNNRLLWVDSNINEDEKDTQHTLEQLRTIIYHIDLFTQINDCLRFLEKIDQEHALIITSAAFGQELVKNIDHLAQVDAIYIFCNNPGRHESWTKDWSKIKGVYNRIKPICEALRTAVKQTNDDLTPISFVTQNVGDDQEKSTNDLNRLEPSFMYTTLFKRILLDMDHASNDRQALVQFCRSHHADNPGELKIIDEFDREYRADKAIWWYTRECFTYQMLNRALRLLESDIIVDMGFFIHDLHRALEELHRQQFSDYSGSPLTLYRGQALSMKDFTKMKKSLGGLVAFNSFLSTSTSKQISLGFAVQNSKRDNMVGIFFVITVEPTIPSAIFANIAKHSYFEHEGEVLFSMHTVFRIDEIVGLDEQKRLFEVRLTLTSDDDPELRGLTNRIEEEVGSGTGWERLGLVLLRMRQVNKAEELYLFLLRQKPSEDDQGHYYHHLGLIKNQQGDYKGAVKYYERSISIKERILCPTDPNMASSYNNIGVVYSNMEEYSQALSYYNKALVIREKTLPANHPDLAASYNNIGGVYSKMGKYSQALPYYNKALAIWEKTLPVNHPSLATSYNNIGALYRNMEEYSQALSYYNKALAIQEKTLHANHPSLATSYNNIGATYYSLKEYSKGKTYCEQALEIWKRALPPGHPTLQTCKRNLESANEKLRQ